MKKNANSQVLGLWHAYQNVKFKLLSGSWAQNQPFYIVTACNPRSKLLSAISNNLRTEKLRRYLEKQQIDFVEMLCGDPDFYWQEHSFALPISEAQVMNLARLYGQNAVYLVQSQKLHLVPVLFNHVAVTEMGLFKKYCVSETFPVKS